MAIIGLAELHGVVDGTQVELEGTYRAFRSFPPPPGPPRNAQVVLADGGAVLIGRYLDTESERPADELARLEGAHVRVAGRFFRTRAWPDGEPMPGVWTGGGPQLVEVTPPVVIAKSPEPLLPEQPPPQAPAEPTLSDGVETAEPPQPATRPRPRRRVGSLAKRSLAYGAFRLLGLVIAVAALAVAATTFALCRAIGWSDVSLISLLSIAAAGLTLLALERALVSWLSRRELGRLATQTWAFDLDAYVALLDTPRGDSELQLEIELTRAPRADVAVRPPRGVTLTWSSDNLASVTGCSIAGREAGAHPRFGPGRPSNAGLHRWHRKLAAAIIVPLHASVGVRRVTARVR